MLTRRQQEIWEVILRWYRTHGYTPTLDEIGKAVGLNSRSTVHQHVKTLIQEEYLQAASGKRAYDIMPGDIERDAQMPLSLPLQGQIAAGHPIEAIPDRNDISPNEMFTGPGRYALKVKGESMIDIGVMDGDYVVIQRIEGSARNGDIVVALVDLQEATLKRIFYHDTGFVELRPENV